MPINPAVDALNNMIQGNFIGTDATGMNGLSIGSDGILIESGSGGQIGGAEPGAGNLISGILGKGITIYLGGPTESAARNSNGGQIIEGNLLGTDVTGLPFSPSPPPDGPARASVRTISSFSDWATSPRRSTRCRS